MKSRPLKLILIIQINHRLDWPAKSEDIIYRTIVIWVAYLWYYYEKAVVSGAALQSKDSDNPSLKLTLP